MSYKYILILICFLLLSGFTDFKNYKCHNGINIEFCLPENLQPIVDPNNSFKNVLPSALNKIDMARLKNLGINPKNMYIDNELSQQWNTVLNDVNRDMLKLRELSERVIKEKFIPLVRLDVIDKKNITAKLVKPNIMSWINQTTAGDISEENTKRLLKELSVFEVMTKSFADQIMNMQYMQTTFDEFYADNKKRVYIVPDVDGPPFVVINGDVYIPRSFLEKFPNKEQIYVSLVHEAFHFYIQNTVIVSKVTKDFFGDKNFFYDVTNAFIDMDGVKKQKNKDKIKDVVDEISSLADIYAKNIACSLNLDSEIDIDRNVIFYLNSRQAIVYRELLTTIAETNENERIRIPLIDVLAEYLKKYNKENFIKEIIYFNQSGLVDLFQRQKSQIANVYITESAEKKFIDDYGKLQSVSKRFIYKANNLKECFERSHL